MTLRGPDMYLPTTVEGCILKGVIQGVENWIYLPKSESKAVLYSLHEKILAISLRIQSEGGRVDFQFNQLPKTGLRCEGIPVTVRVLTQDEILSFCQAFIIAKVEIRLRGVHALESATQVAFL